MTTATDVEAVLLEHLRTISAQLDQILASLEPVTR
jgi:hypothetical protein